MAKVYRGLSQLTLTTSLTQKPALGWTRESALPFGGA